MKKEPGIYELKKWEGQLFNLEGYDVEWLPSKVQFDHEEVICEEEHGHHFIVSGNVWDIEFNTGFRFHKAFYTEETAENFFQKMKERYPNSRFYMKEVLVTMKKKYY